MGAGHKGGGRSGYGASAAFCPWSGRKSVERGRRREGVGPSRAAQAVRKTGGKRAARRSPFAVQFTRRRIRRARAILAAENPMFQSKNRLLAVSAPEDPQDFSGNRQSRQRRGSLLRRSALKKDLFDKQKRTVEARDRSARQRRVTEMRDRSVRQKRTTETHVRGAWQRRAEEMRGRSARQRCMTEARDIDARQKCVA